MKKKYLMGLLLASGISVNAQFGVLDHSLDPGTGADLPIQAIALQDGKIIVGGDFQLFNGSARKHIARLNPDGSLDNSFSIGSGANKPVTDVAVQSDKKVLVTGEFTIFNNSSKKRIARLNQDGSIDNSFTPGYGANERIATIFLQNDGKMMIGGIFTAFNWIPCGGIARLNADGTLDTSFSYNGLSLEVVDIRQTPDGKYIVNALNKIIRLNADGSIDGSFNQGSGTDNPIHYLYVQQDNKIIVGGYFTSYNGIPANRIVRLNSDGSVDMSFHTGSGANYGVLSISEQFDGKLIISGLFSHYNGIPREKVARLHPDGNLDETFNSMLGPDNIVLSHLQQPDGRILIAGDFNAYNGVPRKRIARINAFESLGTFPASVTKADVWPNPASDYLNIFAPDSMTMSVNVYDLQGKMMIQGSDSRINISGLAAGVYFANITTATGSSNVKFIKI